MVTTLGPDPGPTLSIEQWMAEGVTTDAFGYPIGQALRIDTRTRYIDGELVRPDGGLEPVEPDPAPARRERDRDGAARAAIFEATGVEVDMSLLDRDIYADDEPTLYVATTTDEEPTPRPIQSHATPADLDTGGQDPHETQRVTWAAKHGIGRASAIKVRPSRTPEGRRARHIREKAERLGISYADAERMTPARVRR